VTSHCKVGEKTGCPQLRRRASLAKLKQQGYVARVAAPADAAERAFGSATVQDLLDAGSAFRAAKATGRAQEDLVELA
jgi:hypothetical protein